MRHESWEACSLVSLDCLQIRTSTQLSSILIPSLFSILLLSCLSCVRGIQYNYGGYFLFVAFFLKFSIFSVYMRDLFSFFLCRSTVYSEISSFPAGGIQNHPPGPGIYVLAKTPEIQHFCREFQHDIRTPSICLCHMMSTSPTAEISEHHVDYDVRTMTTATQQHLSIHIYDTCTY